ncbi:thymidine kinase [Gallaecimonas xiamenensis]|uniref:Thymidine kinase n=1 Tax=Gallaecimonas xiamenensis 3-C-1 TaxID=745411 RepID=K2IZT0_9GAMM|nr:thymidine kinase [Gallaecimonas xiamenensis]EKE68403.1 thymidine kinase [Gallaecimonas xiamenensis 3-C-1]
MAQLYFYYSAMNAGKSTSLLQSAYNYRERGMNALLYTAAVDDRSGKGMISSRIGLESEACVFDPQSDLFAEVLGLSHTQRIHCLLLDEAQFLSKAQVAQLCRIVDELGIPVLAFGLRTDFRAELFEGAQYLLAWADKLVELKTVCHCGRKANRVLRVGADGQPIKEGAQVEIGGNDRYVSVCRKHYIEALARP